MSASFIDGNRHMTNSRVGDRWIEDTCRANPTVIMPGEGRLILSGPVRLSFCQLFEPKAPQNNSADATPKFSVTALFTPFSDMNVYYSEWYRVAGETFPERYDRTTGQYGGLENPFHNQADKSYKYEGYTPGLTYLNMSSKFKPAIVDSSPAKNVITDVSKVYPGVWAMIISNTYAYGKTPPRPKKGVSFGLQAVVIIGDDVNISGSTIDPREAFAGINVRPPVVTPGSLAGVIPPPPNGAPVGPPPLVGTSQGWTPPGAPASFVAPPPNPLQSGFRGMPPAADDPYDTSALR